jgi:putative peptidoglycan lipid II flippase
LENSAEHLPVSETQAATNAGVARATGVLALGNIASRVLGLAREIALTNLFGASRAVDAFNYAILVPKTLYDLLIAGHVNSAIIPVLSEVITREGAGAFWRLVSILVSMITVLGSGIALLLIGFAPHVIGVISSGSDAPTQTLAADLLRWIAPALLFLSLFAVLSGALYALRAFSLPAFAGAIFNGGVVLATISFAPTLGIHAAALGWLIGALAQLTLLVPGLWRGGGGLRLTIDWRSPAVRRIALLYAPVLASLVIDTFVRTFSYNLASQTGVGSVSYMNWATTLIQFPQGLVATAISIAILPTLSRQAVARDADGERAFKATLGLGLRLSITLMIPAVVGLFVLAIPIIRLIFEHGAFNPVDTQITALALRLYLVGLPFAAVDLLLVYAFYARQDTLTPALIGLISLVVYTLVAVTLLPMYGLFSLMIADSVKHITHTLLCGLILSLRLRGLGDQRLVITLVKTGLAAALMALAVVISEPVFERMIGTETLIEEIALVALTGGVAIGVFSAAAVVLRVQEFRSLFRLIRRR